MNPSKLTLTAILIAISGFVASPADAEDRLAGDLFSAITMSETTHSNLDPNLQSAKQEDEVLGVVSLSKIFSRAKIQYEIQSTKVLVGVANLSPNFTGTTTLEKLQLSVDAESQRIDVMLPLSAETKNKAVQGKQLMSLLVRLSNVSGVHLTATEQAIALHTSLSNQDVTLQDLRTAAERLIAAAEKTEPGSAGVAATSQRVVPTQSANTSRLAASKIAVTTAKPASLVGTWSAKTSATDAWAIRFNADSSFVMVHTRSGKNSVSRGNYTLTSNQLAVSEKSGVSLKGLVNRSSEKSFAWKLQNNSGQTLITLTFKKK